MEKANLKTLGLIGGTSWHSTVEYYSIINQMTNDIFQNNTNPPLVLINLDQHHIHLLQKSGRWDSIATILSDACQRLQKAGAEAVLFCANTPHRMYHEVQRHSTIPILHIGDAIGNAIVKMGLNKVGLIGTIFTMEEPFMINWLKDKYRIDTIVPDDKEQRQELHSIIQKELSLGVLKSSTKKYVLDQIFLLKARGAEGIILGCTEFPLLIKQEDIDIPIFNTTLLHSQAGVDFILG
ncbi:aspartate/glutamate racemase family protein [Chryseobacterium sp. Alg-005]|uniref:aspartate/glutamate racemase family protein n=1 Tax=Chryseobacterium sp. Alg-005 TaxID=3159516 RepID=UPI0036F2037B